MFQILGSLSVVVSTTASSLSAFLFPSLSEPTLSCLPFSLTPSYGSLDFFEGFSN